MKPIPRALRHLGLTVGSWIGCRFLFLAWAGFSTQPSLDRLHSDGQTVATLAGTKAMTSQLAIAHEFIAPPIPKPEGRDTVKASRNETHEPAYSVLAYVQRTEIAVPLSLARVSADISPAQRPKPVEPAPVSLPTLTDNWSLAAYAIYRPDSGTVSLSPSSQLGGSQFGFRAQRRLLQPIPNVTLSLNLRASTPLKVSNGKEAGVGLAIRRAGRIPVEFIAERRVGLDRGGRNAFAGLIATGINDLPIAAGFNLNGYVQAGVVGLRKHDGFADGSLRLEREVASAQSLKFQLGAGIWGAIQPGVSRVDIGPSAAIRFRVGSAGVRLGGEWRQRVSGNASPGSGPAITFGLDY